MAKDLGVDLASLTPSGPGGVVTREDVQAAASGASTSASSRSVVLEARASHLDQQAGSDPARRASRPHQGRAQVTAQAMVDSAFTAPHVTEFVTVDVTATMDLVDRLKKDRAFRDVKVTPLLVVAKALCLAIRRNPDVNASWDEAAQEIVYRRDVNRHRRGDPPRARRAEHQGRGLDADARARRRDGPARRDGARGSHPAGGLRRRHGDDHQRRRLRRLDTGPPRSSTPARRRSSPSARCGGCRGSSSATASRASSRAG